MAIKIVILESYYGGSHQTWADGYQQFSQHDVTLVTLPAQFWKWRMQGGAISFARLMDFKPDVILASSMIDLSIFRSLTYRELGDVPIAMYFHENQLSYPQNQRQHHGWRYGFINFVSALVADANFFNSPYHLQDFGEQLPRLLKHFADYNELQTIDNIIQKSSVLPVGIDFSRYAQRSNHTANTSPLILWNHRWEDDKNPQLFIDSMIELHQAGYDFRVAITGENFQQEPKLFDYARQQLGDKVIQLGYVATFEDYVDLLWQADYVVSTAYQEFFGISICEAIYCHCIPILPNRLNYPNLIPANTHAQCLYSKDKLTSLLKHHLDDTLTVDTAPLKAKIAQFDWTTVAQQYDTALSELIRQHP
jgi:glycosyltransferase involved in cell wall biosynthesis